MATYRLHHWITDIAKIAEGMGEPFRWDGVLRAQLRAELDAYYARLYGLTRDELRYILHRKELALHE